MKSHDSCVDPDCVYHRVRDQLRGRRNVVVDVVLAERARNRPTQEGR